MFWKKTKDSPAISSPESVLKSEGSWWSNKKDVRKVVSREQYPSEAETGLLYQEAYSQIRSIVPKGAIFEGSLSYQVPVRVEGVFHGDLISSSDVILAPGSQVSGRIECQSFYSFGEVQGKVHATKTIIYPQARVTADIYCNNLSFANGAVFEGRCQME